MIRRFLSTLLALVTASQLTLASAAEANLWQQRRQAQAVPQYASLPMGMQAGPGAALLRQMPELQKQVVRPDNETRKIDASIPTDIHDVLEKIPENAGEIREVYVAEKSRDLVLLIQDVHLHKEAQENISNLLLSFGPEPMVVGVEGASGDFDRSTLQEVADPKIRKAVADSFLRDNEISAVSHAGIVAPRGSLELVGIDDATHYEANVSAYREAVRRKSIVTTAMDAEERTLQDAKRSALKGDVSRFDVLRTEYEKGAIGLGVYLERLSNFRDKLDGAFLDAGEIDRFLEAFRIEKELDFKQVERQRTGVMQDLVGKASDSELKNVLAETLAYRAGAVSYADFYRYLDSQLKEHSISLQKMPAFKRYIEYVLMADTIKPDRVLEAMGALEAAVTASLAKTLEERKLLAQSHSLFLRRKLVNFGLTWPEWRQYQSLRQPGMEDFEKFYSEADERSEHMVESLLTAMDKHSSKGMRRSAMVAGGFHTPELTARLKSRGVSYAVIQPRITKVDGSGTEYLSIFVREKTPLEKIFEGQKLFLAPANIIVGTQAGRAVTEKINLTGSAVVGQGQPVVSPNNPTVFATTGAQPDGATPLGSKEISGYGVVRYFQRAGNAVGRFFSNLSRALNLSNASKPKSDSFLGAIGTDKKLRDMAARVLGLPAGSSFDAVAEKLPTQLRTNKDLVAALVKARPALPVGVPLHLNSHQDLITSLIERSRNRSFFQRMRDRWNGVPEFTPAMAIIGRTFVELHDLGYSIDFGNRATFDADLKADLTTVWTKIAEAARHDKNNPPADLAAAQANDRRLAEAAYNLVAPNAEGKLNYMLHKVLAHGSTSIVLAMRRFEKEGFTPDQALGMALLFAAHHPGFPITLVDQFVVPGMIPTELLQVLLINDLKPGTTERGNPDDLRIRIADFVSDSGLLKMSRAEARQVAVLGYSLDRITPARRMRDFFFDNLQFKADGTFDRVDPARPDFWTGGETSKKYPLIVTNIKAFEELNVRNIYGLTLGNVRKEADAAVAAADRATQGLSENEGRPLLALKAITQTQSDQEIAATKEIQDRAISFIDRIQMPAGEKFGDLINLDRDTAILATAYRQMPESNPDREAAGYLLGTMIAFKLSPLVAPHVAKLKAEFDKAQKIAGARTDPAFQALQRAVAEQVERHESLDELQAPLILSILGEFERTGVEGVTLGIAQPGETLVSQTAAGETLPRKTPDGRPTGDLDVYITYEGTLNGVGLAGSFEIVPGSVVGELALVSGIRNATLSVPADGQPVRYVRVTAELMDRLLQNASFMADYQAVRRQRLAPQAAPDTSATQALMEAAAEDPTVAMSLAASAESALTEQEIRTRLLDSAGISARQGAAELALVTAVLAYAQENPQANLLGSDRIERLEAGKELFHYNDQSDDLYLVLEGKLTVVNGVVITQEARHIIGEMALTNGGRRTATVTASEGGARVLKIPGSVLRALLANPDVYASYRALVKTRLANQLRVGATPTYQGTLPKTLTGRFALNIGRMFFFWLSLLGVSQRAIDNITRLSIGLVVEFPIFVVGFIPGVMTWFMNDHLGNGAIENTPANRQKIERGVAIIYAFSALGLALGLLAGVALGYPSLDLLKFSAVGFAAGNILSHFGLNVSRLLAGTTATPVVNAPTARPATEIEAAIAAVAKPLEANMPVDRTVVAALIPILFPRADRALGVADAARAAAIASLGVRLDTAARPDSGQALTAGELADIVSLLVVLKAETVSVNLDDATVKRDSTDIKDKSTFVRVVASKSVADLQGQIESLDKTKGTSDVGVIVLDAALYAQVVGNPLFNRADIRFMPNDARLDLSPQGLSAVTGLDPAVGKIQIALSKQASLTDRLIQQIEAMKQGDTNNRVAVFLLLDEAMRAMPLAIEQISELVRVHRLIAIQA